MKQLEEFEHWIFDIKELFLIIWVFKKYLFSDRQWIFTDEIFIDETSWCQISALK